LPVEWIANASEWIGAIATTMLLTLSPRFRQLRRVTFLNTRREAYLSLALWSLIMIIAIMLYSADIRPSLLQISADTLWLRLIVAMISLLPFAVTLFYQRHPLLSVCWGKQMIGPSLQLGFALVLLTIFLRGKITPLISGGVSSEEWQALSLWCGICLAEESIFRGFIRIRIAAWLGEWQGWMISALLYMLWQLPRLWGVPLDVLTPALIYALLQGMLLGWIAYKNGHLFAPVLYRIVSEWVVSI
jgi:membrane protease YdiL (CAAX protease family)